MKRRRERKILVLLAIFACIALAVPADGRGLVPVGGSVSVGLSAGLLPTTLSRPVPPLCSMLLDESYETIFPIGSGMPIALWDKSASGGVRLILKPNIAWGDSPDRLLTSDDVIACWSARAEESWEARWALRAIAGIEDQAPGISGLQAIDEKTIAFTLRAGAGADELQKEMTTLSLRLSQTPGDTESAGTGPFGVADASGDRESLVHIDVHHAGRAWLDQVGVNAYPSANESVVDFGRGSLDALLLSSNEKDQYEATSRAAAGRVDKVGQAVLVLLLNPARLPSLEERKGLALATDRGGIASVVLGGGSEPAGDFHGATAQPEDWKSLFEQARTEYAKASDKSDKIVLLLCDDPAALEAAGRLRANWESLGVPVEIRASQGPLMLSLEADAALLALRIPTGGEGVLPQCLALYDRSSWWETAAIALGDKGSLLRNVRNLEPGADIGALGSAMQDAALAVPLVSYDILFAPGPGVSISPEFVYPGPVLWRAYKGG